ncbi:ankyrin [Wilcoxina mikolae CBS 423.85]|nr:ankyrin [Wilcoxina mikolae CBS 423.85]
MTTHHLLHFPLELLLLILENLDTSSLCTLLSSSPSLTTSILLSTPSVLTRRPTLLHHAAKHNYLPLLRTLLPLIPASPKNALNETPLTIAASAGHISAVKLLLPYTPDVSAALIAAAAAGHTPVVALLLMSPPHAKSTLTSALCAAAGSGCVATVNLLLLLGGVGAHECDGYGSSPLMWAAKKGRTEVVRMLLGQKGVRRWIDAQDVHGWTAMHWAVFGGWEGVVNVLIAEGADRGVRNDEGWSCGVGGAVVEVAT